MMSSFRVKLMAAVVLAVFLLMGDIPTTSALVPYGSRKSFWLVYSTTRDGSTKKVPREEVSSKGLNTSLRGVGVLSPPPSPIKNRQSSMRAAAPPPDQIQ